MQIVATVEFVRFGVKLYVILSFVWFGETVSLKLWMVTYTTGYVGHPISLPTISVLFVSLCWDFAETVGDTL